jgi:acetylornithine deacetylase/succinyl-diaminopimelate desuccinylase-like protein
LIQSGCQKKDGDYDYDVITDLQTLIRQPSVSAKNQGLVECASLVVRLMRKAGINAKLLYVKNNLQNAVEDDIDPSSTSSAPPIVYGKSDLNQIPTEEPFCFTIIMTFNQ